jgi:hypothetical protein
MAKSTMNTEEVIPQLAAKMSAAFKKVWEIVGATNPGDFDLVATWNRQKTASMTQKNCRAALSATSN